MTEKGLCIQCKGRGLCGKPCRILAKFQDKQPRFKEHFSGSSPPEIFVGRMGYPNINTGILAPQEHGDTEELSMPESWYEKNLNIDQILENRSKLIYGRFKSEVTDARKGKKLLGVMQEVSLATRSVSTEIILKRIPSIRINLDSHTGMIGNPAPLKFARLEQNPHTDRKSEYLSSDTHVKATQAIRELYKGKIQVSNIIKMLSAGMLGQQTKRKLVPTRWSITATDDTISKLMLEKIRYYQEISEIQLFHGYYVGNHYEFLLLPDKFSFEVLEAYLKGSLWNTISGTSLSQDYEGFSGRKTYADSVTGAYYTARVALCEYLEKIKRQAACLVMREERPEYYAPLGVGILRELARDAFSKQPEKFDNIQEALKSSSTRLNLDVSFFTQKSWLLKNYGKQTRLSKFI